MKVRYLTLSVPPELDGAEVNTLLRRVLYLSGTVLRRVKWLEDGIAVDGRRVNVRHMVRAGQTLSVRLSDPAGMERPVPAPGPLDLVYEDEDLAVVNKAPGVLVHPSHGHFTDTIGNFLMRHYEENDSAAGFHPVHRLDKGTSGLLVVAKHAYAQERLKQQLHTGEFRRVYLAICEGTPNPAAGVIDAPIGRAEGFAIRREVRPDGKPARTRYQTLAAGDGLSLLALELESGRTHQIRVHLAHIGCPLAGDFLYGREDPAWIARPALHSARLSLRHPLTGEYLSLASPLPADMDGKVKAAGGSPLGPCLP